MNRNLPPVEQPSLFVEALEPRIAPAGLLNESKFTSVVAGGTLLLDASDPNGFQGLSTGFGANAGGYLLYVTAGKALIYTSDLNGNGILDANEITGISAGVDAQGRSLDLIAFTNINGDVVTNLLSGTGVSSLTDSDNDPNNGRDGRVLLDNGIHSITLRSLTAADIDTTIPGNSVFNRLVTTNYSIFGNIYTGADFGASGAGLTIDTSGSGLVGTKFLYNTGTPQIGDILTGTAASNQHFRFTISSGVDIQNTLLPFTPRPGEHGGDIIGINAADSDTFFDIGTLATGNGGVNARGGNFQEIVLHGDRGGYKLIAGDGGQGAVGAVGGSIINFSDLGTVTSEVILHTGSGGIGLLGAGGQGGTATFANASISANVKVVLGDGGNGFTAGGNGAGQATALFTPPDTTVSVGGSVLGTYHANGDVGNFRSIGTNAAGQILFGPRSIDFNGDGFGDAIYTTTNPDQIVILFGDGTGNFFDTSGTASGLANFASRTIYLDAPGVSAKTITVGDFNGDGKLDIAAASAVGSNAAGVSVFLNQIGDTVRNPLGGRLITGNPLGDHPFSNALRSPLPIVAGGSGGSTPIYAIAAGDFNGDGITDLGVATNSALLVLFGDTDANALKGNGYFYAKPAGASPVQFIRTNLFDANAILKATAITANSGAPDVLIYTDLGTRAINELSIVTNVNTGTLGTVTRGFSIGSVDTNRNPGQTATQPLILQDFSLQDIDANGAVDVVVLGNQPLGFIATLRGDGIGGFGVASGAGDNAGIFVANGLGGTATAIVPTDLNRAADGTLVQDSIFAEFALLTVPDRGSPFISEIALSADGTPGTPDFTANGAGTVIRNSLTLSNVNGVLTVAGLGNYYAQVGIAGSAAFPLVDVPITGYGVVDPNTDDARYAIVDFFSFGGLSFNRYLTDNGIKITAGRGGDSIAGLAGAGGSIGTLANTGGDPFGSVRVILPSSPSYRGQVELVGGDGGNGFSGGGTGGDIQGVSVRFKDTAIIFVDDGLLSAGNGGNGISGNGGRGGNVRQFSVDALSFFSAGNGGSGLRGGQGGSITGSQTGTFDARSGNITAVAGFGGLGALGGGVGGDISQLNSVILGGSLLYISGDGGNAVAGNGGSGGGILNSSPNTSVNLLAGNLGLQTGSGGSGLTGGNGGAITNFLNQSTDPLAVPQQLVVITGNGGAGVVSQGGVGGAITNFRSNTIGLNGTLTRIIAGNGGASYGNIGGVGGSITNATSQSSSGAIAVVAGAGGSGLTVGGNGGSVANSTINSAAQTLGKVLVIAGAGGDATSVARADVLLPDNSNPQDLAHAILAFGGASGVGGNGGNITDFVQPVSVQTAVDLIAGNGGSTVNTGTTLSASTNVGRGGSVVNAILTGTAGASTRDPNTNVNPAIRSYTDTNNDGVDDVNVATFVQNSLVGSLAVNGAFIPDNASSTFQLINANGNVGIVAGIAGQVKGGQPARDGVNGSVQNVSAGSIMSIVAGSVNRVSPVTTLSGISVKNLDGVLGADKSQTATGDPNNRVEYAAPVLDSAGNIVLDPVTGRPQFTTVSNLQPGYRLIDGALYAQSIDPTIQGPRVFSFTQG